MSTKYQCDGTLKCTVWRRDRKLLDTLAFTNLIHLMSVLDISRHRQTTLSTLHLHPSAPCWYHEEMGPGGTRSWACPLCSVQGLWAEGSSAGEQLEEGKQKWCLLTQDPDTQNCSSFCCLFPFLHRCKQHAWNCHLGTGELDSYPTWNIL